MHPKTKDLLDKKADWSNRKLSFKMSHFASSSFRRGKLLEQAEANFNCNFVRPLKLFNAKILPLNLC